jgi:lipopolysaccharide transport system permease protein
MSAGNWDIVITPRREFLDLSGLWRYRDLIVLLVKRDFVAFYKQTILGPLWYLLQPLFTTCVFTVVFSRIANIPTDGIPAPLFYMAGIVLWSYFANCMTKTSDTFAANAGVFGKVYFPRLVVPIAIVITNLISLCIQVVMLLAMFAYFSWQDTVTSLNPWLFAVPILVLQVAALGLGVGALLSSLTTKYRDLVFVVGFGTQLWMYATPIVYPLSQVPQQWHWFVGLNPMTAVVEAFRYALFGTGTVHPEQLAVSAVMTFAVLAIGVVLFTRVERTSMDTV